MPLSHRLQSGSSPQERGIIISIRSNVTPQSRIAGEVLIARRQRVSESSSLGEDIWLARSTITGDRVQQAALILPPDRVW